MTVTEFIVQTGGVGDHLLVRILEVEVSKKLQIWRLNLLGRGGVLEACVTTDEMR